MAGTLEYLRWRGDLSFKERPFNSVDVSLRLHYLSARRQICQRTHPKRSS